MNTLRVLVPLLLVSATAIAQADDTDSVAASDARPGYANVLTLSVMRDVGDPFQRRALAFEASHRLGDGLMHVHAELAVSERGTRGGELGMVSASYDQFRAGLEARGRGWVRLVAGADVGYGRQQTTTNAPMLGIYNSSHVDNGLMLVPRAAVELGERVRVRLGGEVDLETDHDLRFVWSIGAGAAF